MLSRDTASWDRKTEGQQSDSFLPSQLFSAFLFLPGSMLHPFFQDNVLLYWKESLRAGSGSGGSLFDFLADSAYDSHHLICLRRQPFQNSAGAFSVSSLLRFHGDDAVADLVTDQNESGYSL